MKKQLKTSTIYQPNNAVKVTVVNKPTVDEMTGQITYDSDVSIKIKHVGRPDELKFVTDEELRQFIINTDFSDPQQPLPMNVSIEVRGDE